mgnify:CR=1 FL=1
MKTIRSSHPPRTNPCAAPSLRWWRPAVRGVLTLLLCGLCIPLSRGAPLGTAFTFQARLTAASLPVFNPFTETPIKGTNYRYGPSFGMPTEPDDYQSPRTFSFSFGIRF